MGMPAEKPQASQNAETPDTAANICPFCGGQVGSAAACPSCRGLQEPLSRQASQNAMGPWFVREAANPFRPGCNLATIRMLIDRGKITRETIIRGPTTGQFWRRAEGVPGLSHLLGMCYSCKSGADAGDTACRNCSARFAAPDDRQHLGLGPVRLLPGHAPADQVADRAMEGAAYAVDTNAAGMRNASTAKAQAEQDSPILKLEPSPEEQPVQGKASLTAEQKAERLARIEREAKLLLEERRARAHGRNAVIGVAIGLLLLAMLAAVLVAIPSGTATRAAPAPAAASTTAGASGAAATGSTSSAGVPTSTTPAQPASAP